MVYGALDSDAEHWIDLVDRAEAVVIGCGLGLQSQRALANACVIAQKAKENSKALVIDGDAITHFCKERPDLLAGNCRIVLTPNAMEFRRIWNAVMPEHKDTPDFDAFERPSGAVEFLSDESVVNAQVELTRQVARKLGGVTILRKGAIDVITDGKITILQGNASSPRRAGGQGDILAGLSGLASFWALKSQEQFVYSAALASVWTRLAAKSAFNEQKSSMITSDILEFIGTELEGIKKN
jgi:ATP-dependent NAD(P)H-hydrate dehydratase